MEIIKSIEQLKISSANINGEFQEFYILLAGGIARSCKRILYFPPTNTFDVINEIDDTEHEDLTETELESKTNIIEAIKNGCLVRY